MSKTLLAEAHAEVATAVSVTGRQVPDELEHEAGELLAALWSVSFRYGVQPEDWAAVTPLPTLCMNVLAAVRRRPRFE